MCTACKKCLISAESYSSLSKYTRSFPYGREMEGCINLPSQATCWNGCKVHKRLLMLTNKWLFQERDPCGMFMAVREGVVKVNKYGASFWIARTFCYSQLLFMISAWLMDCFRYTRVQYLRYFVSRNKNMTQLWYLSSRGIDGIILKPRVSQEIIDEENFAGSVKQDLYKKRVVAIPMRAIVDCRR